MSRAFSTVGRGLCLGGAMLGSIGLIGWIAGIPFLTMFVRGQPAMMPNTAVGLLLLGVGAALRHRQAAGTAPRILSAAAAAVVLVIGTVTLAEYTLQTSLGIDQLLVSGLPGPYPGRPSPPTALALGLLAIALLVYDARPAARARPSEWLSVAAGLTAFIGLLGYAFGAGRLYRLSSATVVGVAMPTAISLLMIATGMLLQRPDAGLMRTIASPGPAGILLRRFVPAAILAPVLLEALARRLVAAAGVADPSLTFAAVAASMSVLAVALLAITAVPLDRAHRALEANRARIRDLVERAPDGIFVADLEGRYTEVNEAGCKMIGYSRAELIGKTIMDIISPEEIPQLKRSKQEMLEGKTHVAEWNLRQKDGAPLPVEVSAAILPDGRWQGLVRDISERKRALEALRQVQERVELALKGADLAAWDWNVTTGEVIFNARWAEMRGYRPEEVAPNVDSWIAGVHPDDLPRVQQQLAEHLEGRVPEYEAELRVRTRSGQWIWILDRGKVFARDADGRPTRMVGTELDITVRKEVEARLRLAEAKASGILSISADAVVTVDEAQRITMFNEGAEKIFGYTKAEALGAPLDLLVPERLRQFHRQHVATFAAGQQTARRMGDRVVSIVGRRKNGDEFPAGATISKLDVGGTRILTVAVRDMTEQKQLEREQGFLAAVGAQILGSTLDQEEMLARIAELAVQDLADYCVVDLIAEDGEIQRMKVACRDPSKPWACEAIQHLPHDRTRPHAVWSVLTTRQPVLLASLSAQDLEYISRNEEHLRVLRALEPRSLIAVPMVARERLLGGITLVSSTPSRVYGLADLALAQELARRTALGIENVRLYLAARKAVQARDDVLGIVAHDLRSPLSSILMQLFRLRRRGPEPERRNQRAVEAIERAGNQMNRLIEDLLDVASMEAGHLRLEQGRVPAAQVVSDALEAQRSPASFASLELRLDVAHDLPDVWADRDRLVRIFENLIGNALKFTEAGVITVGAAPRDDQILFWVADTGAGVPAESMPHLFEPFWQARKTDRRGAGLGLPIVKGIVEAHGGRIWAESKVGVGTTVFFTIPCAPLEVDTAQMQGLH